jgi:hypothetical protein
VHRLYRHYPSLTLTASKLFIILCLTFSHCFGQIYTIVGERGKLGRRPRTYLFTIFERCTDEGRVLFFDFTSTHFKMYPITDLDVMFKFTPV